MRMSKWLIYLLMAGALFFQGFRHPFYMSVTEIFQNPKSQSLEISLKVFSDDLERVIGVPCESPEADAHIMSYLQHNFKLDTDGSPHTLRWVGKESQPDATWIYLEAISASPIRSLTIENRILTEIHEAQRNIVHVKANGQTKSLLLQRGHEREGVTW